MKKHFDKIILLTGQSNAIGQFSGNKIINYDSDDRIYAYNINKNLWIQFQYNTEIGSKPTNNECFAYYFAKRYLHDYPQHTVGIIVFGQAATPISHWIVPNLYLSPSSIQNNYDNGVIFHHMNYHMHNALDCIKNKYINIILWHQGENDVNETNMYYFERLQALISQFRCSKLCNKNLKFIAGELKSGKQNIALNMLNYDNDKNTACAYTSFIDSVDNVHFTCNGFCQVGYQYYYTYQNMLKKCTKKYFLTVIHTYKSLIHKVVEQHYHIYLKK